ncbi:hypothetical protein GOBAR_DD00906 [Gossypium barbadense]|nr:hypothetical protein GOBAR_DD00906 [Gossypium barbadense]
MGGPVKNFEEPDPSDLNYRSNKFDDRWLVIEVDVPAKDIIWLQYCLVGCIKNMYNVELVQEALRSDGLCCSVCKWKGISHIVKFETKEDFYIAWNQKREIAHLGSLNFYTLGSLWGYFINLLPETRDLVRFDIANMVIKVSSTTNIPSQAPKVFADDWYGNEALDSSPGSIMVRKKRNRGVNLAEGREIDCD